MRRILLKWIARLAFQLPYTVVFFALIFTFASVVWILRLEIETDILKLLPSTPATREYRRTLDQFGTFDYGLIVLEAKSTNQEDLLTSAADTLSTYLSDRHYIFDIRYSIDENAQTFYLSSLGEQGQRFVNLLTNADWEQILGNRLSAEEIRKSLMRIRNRQISILPGVTEQSLAKDPLDIGRVVGRRLNHSMGPIPISLEKGYFLDRNNQMLLMVVKPTQPASDLLFTREYMRFVRGIQNFFIQRHPQLGENLYMHFIGAHTEIQDNAAFIRRDMQLAMAASFFLVMGLFMVVFRRVGALLFVGIPLLLGILWTLGFAGLVYGRITAITVAFMAVLMGLSIDFAIHIYNRFILEMEDHGDLELALERALLEKGEGIITCALTTAIAFYGIFITTFRGFQELGIVAGTGILLCLVSMLIVQPALMVIRESFRRTRFTAHQPQMSLLSQVTTMVESYPRIVMLLGLIITAYFGYHATLITFDDDLGQLKQPSRQYRRQLNRIKSRFEIPVFPLAAVVEAPTLDEALRKNDLLYDELERLHDEYNLVSYDSLRRIFPSTESQKQSHEHIMQLDLNQLEQRLRDEATSLSLRAQFYRPFLERMYQWKDIAQQGSIIEWNDQLNPLIIDRVQKYVFHDRNRYRVITLIYPGDDQWRHAIPASFLDQISDRIGRVTFTGTVILARELEYVLKRDLVWVIGIVALGIFLILLLHFKSIRPAVAAMIPLFCSVIWLLGSAQLAGLQLNFMNIIFIPMVIGLGIDDGIHILQRYYEQGQEDIRAAIVYTGRAIGMSSLTTMLSFGTLLLADFRGVREIGMLCVLGVLYALIASLMLLPSMLWVVGGKFSLLDLIGTDTGVTK